MEAGLAMAEKKIQVDSKPISDAEKFGYLLELVHPKVRDRLSNLKPGPEGYKTAWERLKVEYGHNKLVIAAHVEEIIKLQTVKGRNYDKVCEFYEILCKNYDALTTLVMHLNLFLCHPCCKGRLPFQ